jgi:hypothetical protein
MNLMNSVKQDAEKNNVEISIKDIQIETLKKYPNFEEDMNNLNRIFSLSMVLGRKLNSKDAETVRKWNFIANKHAIWLNGSFNKNPTYKLTSRPKTLQNTQEFADIVSAINKIILQLPDYLI